MAFGLRETRKAFAGKLGFDEDASGKHVAFSYWHEGTVVARTHISHGAGKDISDGVISAMARQLSVSAPELRDAISCTIGRDAFLELLLEEDDDC